MKLVRLTLIHGITRVIGGAKGILPADTWGFGTKLEKIDPTPHIVKVPKGWWDSADKMFLYDRWRGQWVNGEIWIRNEDS